jgi:hypothetical protein
LTLSSISSQSRLTWLSHDGNSVKRVGLLPAALQRTLIRDRASVLHATWSAASPHIRWAMVTQPRFLMHEDDRLERAGSILEAASSARARYGHRPPGSAPRPERRADGMELLSALQDRALRHQTLIDVAPKGDEELSCHCDYRDAADTPTHRPDTCGEPLADGRARLVT